MIRSINGEALEGVLGVEDAGAVGGLLVDEQRPLGVGPVDRGPADDHREFQAGVVEFLDAQGHLLARADEQGGEADRGGVRLDGLVDDLRDRDLLAQVVDGVAVVGQDRVDQVLADVVDVAEDGGQDDRPLGDAFLALQVGLQAGDGLLHRLGRLEHEGQDQLAGAELVADLLHRGQKDVVEDLDGVAGFAHRLVDLVLDPLFLAADDAEVEALAHGHARHRVGAAGVGRFRAAFEVLDVVLEGVRVAGEDQVFGQVALFRRDLGEGQDVRGVDDRQIESRLDAVVEEDGVEDPAGGRIEPEGDVGDAEDREDARHCLPRSGGCLRWSPRRTL